MGWSRRFLRPSRTHSKNETFALQNSATLASRPHNIAYAHFEVEIDRSQKFIAMLRSALKKAETNINKEKAQKDSESAFSGNWKYVAGDYVIAISGADGAIKGTLTASTKPEKDLPHDYRVGTDMFRGGKMQPDGSMKVQWVEYTWKSPSLNKLLGGTTSPATIRLRPDKEAFGVTGNHREIDLKPSKEKWENSFGSAFKYSFIKID